jgi:hypothetical protein
MSDTTNITTSRPRRVGGARRRVRGRTSYRTGSFEVFTYPHHSLPAVVTGVLWRARVELTTVLTLIMVWVLLAREVPGSWPSWTAPVILVTSITMIGVVPASRRFVLRRGWCVFTRHRVRKCFVQSRVMTHEGFLPLFMWARPTPVGDRLWLWLRPGLSGRDIEGVADRIAAACWASTARVRIRTKRAAIVVVDVIRRDPLADSGPLSSPLLKGVAVVDDARAEGGLLLDRATVMASQERGVTPVSEPAVPGEPAPVARGGAMKRNGSRTAMPTQTPEVSVVGWSGKDVSDYV